MKHRISAGAIIEQDGRFLLVNPRLASKYDFWVAPGGGVKGTESLGNAAKREVLGGTLEVANPEAITANAIDCFYPITERTMKPLALKTWGTWMESDTRATIAQEVVEAKAALRICRISQRKDIERR